MSDTSLPLRHAELPAFTPSPNPLEAYFDAHVEGRGIWKWRHYFEVYHRHFSKFIGQEVRILEVGVYSGGSLDMWRSYFGPRCKVYGVDIEEACKAYQDDSIEIHIGDQADPEFWRRFKRESPPVHIIIDDGGHLTHQQVVTFEEMFSHLQPGGVYVCEDVHGEFNPFHSYVHGLSRHLHSYVPGRTPFSAVPSALQRSIRSVHLYPFMVVIEKAETPIGEFVAPKHGTQWQPYL